MKIVAISDTHTYHNEVKLPDGDVLIHAGDLMGSGYRHDEIKNFAKWFAAQPHKHKILVAGNHDRLFETQPEYALSKFVGIPNFYYLNDSGCEIDGIKFWGSPYQPWFYDWAFNVPRGPAIKKHWDKIPEGTDVLITHGPPMGHLDQAIPYGLESNWESKFIVHASEHVGCEELNIAVQVIRPRVHIFGHIHGSYGVEETPSTNFHNVSICNEQYNAVNHPHQIYIERKV